MKLISKTVVRHEGKSDQWPRYHIVREYYYVDNDIIVGDDALLDMALLDAIFWTGNSWSDERKDARIYVNLKDVVEEKDKIEENLT